MAIIYWINGTRNAQQCSGRGGTIYLTGDLPPYNARTTAMWGGHWISCGPIPSPTVWEVALYVPADHFGEAHPIAYGTSKFPMLTAVPDAPDHGRIHRYSTTLMPGASAPPRNTTACNAGDRLWLYISSNAILKSDLPQGSPLVIRWGPHNLLYLESWGGIGPDIDRLTIQIPAGTPAGEHCVGVQWKGRTMWGPPLRVLNPSVTVAPIPVPPPSVVVPAPGPTG